MCASVVTPWASTASPSFVQRSSRESSASSLRWSRKLSSCGFVRFDIGAGEGTTRRWVREFQKLGLRFDTVCTVFPEYPLKRAQRHLPNEGRCCGTSPRLIEYGKDTGWTVSSIPEANCILGGASSGLVYGPPKAFRSAQRFQFHIPSFLWRPRSARQRC